MKRIILSLLLTLSLTLSLLPAVSAAGIPGEEKLPGEAGYGFTYAFVSPTTIEITAYYGYEAEVTVPSTIDGYTVVGIQSFHNEDGYSNPNIFVRKVVLPETVTYIADGAFYDNDDWSAKTHFELREIVLPQSLKTIGKNAFYHNYYLQKIDIPAGVTEIGAGAFAKCQNLSDITIRGENTLLHGGGEGGCVSGLHPLEPLGKAAKEQREDDAGVAPGTLKQSGGGDGGCLPHGGGSGLAQCLGSGGDGHGHIGARVTVRHGEYIKIVDGLLLGRDSGGPVQDHLLEKRAGDFFTHSSAVLLTGSWNLRTHPQRGPPHRCSYSPRSVPRS